MGFRLTLHCKAVQQPLAFASAISVSSITNTTEEQLSNLYFGFVTSKTEVILKV